MTYPNTPEWLNEIITIPITRQHIINLLAILINLQKFYQPDQQTTHNIRVIAQPMLDRLRYDGLELPQELWAEYIYYLYIPSKNNPPNPP